MLTEHDALVEQKTPRELFEAIGDLALAIAPHNMDSDQRRKIRNALHVLVDHIIQVGESRATIKDQTDETR